MDTTWTLGLASVLSILGYYLMRKSTKPVLSNAPPCLPSLPIIGSLPFIGGLNNTHVLFHNLTKKYGNVYSLYLGPKYFLMLNGYDAIREALGKNALAFADRGKIIVDGKVWDDTGKGIVFHCYHDELRASRHNAISVLKNFGFGVKSVMESRIHTEATHLIEYITSLRGKDWYPEHFFAYVTLNVIFNLMFSERLPYGDEMGHFIIAAATHFADSADLIYEVFPLLMEIPPFAGKLANHRKSYIKWLAVLEDKVKQIMASESEEENFVTEYVKIVGRENISARDLAVIVRDLLLGGTETTSGQLGWSLILLANHPEIQSRLQKDIDSVVERGRFPSLDDKDKLSYLEATILEVMRIRTALPLSVPRFTKTQAVVGGYTVPEGAEVLVNLWSAHMNPEVWPQPEVFRPERFLDGSGNIVNREKMITFSLGKRVCLGEVLARQEMFLFLAAMIQQFNILPPEGEDKVKDEMRFVRALTPAPHKLRLVPRL